MLKRLVLLWLFLSTLAASAATNDRITLTLTLRTNAVTGDQIVFSAPVARTITWTNGASATTVSTNTDVLKATTNLFLQLAQYSIGTPRLIPDLVNSNIITLTGEPGQALAASIVSASSGWASITLSTNPYVLLTTVQIPLNEIKYASNRVRVASELVKGMGELSTNAFGEYAAALGNYVSSGASTQTVTGPKTLNKLAGGTNVGTVAGGHYTSATNVNPRNSNAVNFGSAFRSDGTNVVSLQLGSNAVASADRSIAIGPDALASVGQAIAMGNMATASNVTALAVGAGAIASGESAVSVGTAAIASGQEAIAVGADALAAGTGAVTIGEDADASGNASIAVGAQAQAMAAQSTAVGTGASAFGANSVALGVSAFADHADSIAIGTSSATTQSGQIMLGSTAVNLVQTFGRIQAESSTNNNITGTNKWSGDLAIPALSVTSLAASNNVLDPKTNIVIRISGVSGNYQISSIQRGRDGRLLELINDSIYTMTVNNESGFDPTAANRIRTPTSNDVSFGFLGVARLRYSDASSRWLLEVATAAATNAIASMNGAGTNLTAWAGSVTATPLSVKVAGESAANLFSVTTNNSGTASNMFWVSSNGVANAVGGFSGANGYVMMFTVMGTLTPADSTTYFFTMTAESAVTTYANVRIAIPRTGILKRVDYLFRIAGTLGSGETVSHYIRLNDTTDVAQQDAVYSTASQNLAVTLTQAVTAGDYVAVKVVCPAWATNPTGLRHVVTLYIE